jgi:hypothetical protein
VVAQVRAALVQDVNMQGFEPYQLSCFQDNRANVGTAVQCVSLPVPAGKRFVVEHLSGYFVTGQTDVVDQISVGADVSGTVHLPTHFRSRLLNFGGELGVGAYNQFGSPARLYVQGGQSLNGRGDSNKAGIIAVVAVGYLVNQ